VVKVARFDALEGKHLVRYADGESEMLVLANERIQWVEGGQEEEEEEEEEEGGASPMDVDPPAPASATGGAEADSEDEKPAPRKRRSVVMDDESEEEEELDFDKSPPSDEGPSPRSVQGTPADSARIKRTRWVGLGGIRV
jgi:hypothetical protein